MEDYDVFAQRMESRFPKIFGGKYGGFCIGPGWYKIVECLANFIQTHIDSNNNARERLLANNPRNFEIPEVIEQVVAEQVKEKFGGLRFYYSGGDRYVDGLVTMAEAWACRTCEECGAPGTRHSDRWIRTLCDYHESQRQKFLYEQNQQISLFSHSEKKS